MMLTIHGLPSVANYQDVRTLLQRECNLNDFILDNLVSDKDGSKKVRIGVADEMEGAHVVKCLDGFRCGGKALYVVPVAKSGPANPQHPPFDSRGNFQRNEFPVQGGQYGQNQMGPGPWNSGNQWAPSQQAGYNYQQPNMLYQQQPQPHRPLNQRELMLQSSRGPLLDSYPSGPPGVQKILDPHARPAPTLRNIETVDLPKSGPARYQDYEHPKPITIKKDNFMGPNQFPGKPNSQNQQSPWHDQGPPHKPSNFGKPNEDDKKYNQPKPGILKNPLPDRARDSYNDKPNFPKRRDSPGRNISPGRRMPPDHKNPTNDHRMPHRLSDHRMDVDHPSGPNDRRMPPGDRRMPIDRMGPNDRGMPPDDRMGPSDRRMPPDDRMGPMDRRMPPDDRMGPIDRRIPPDDRMGPSDRRMPLDDRMRPNDRRMPPDDRMGPNDRRMPPEDRMGPNDRRMPPDNRIGPNDRRMPPDDRMGPNDRRMPPDDRMGPNDRRMPIDDRMGPNNRKLPPNDRLEPNDRRMMLKDDRIGPNDQRIGVSHPDRRLSPGRRISPPGRRISPPGRRIISPERRNSPPGRRISPPGRRVSPPGRQISPSGRRISPPGRRISPPGRRISPPGRRISPSGRRISPPGRRISPPGRRISPSGRRISPPGRRISPSGHHVSPGRRMSPSDRRISPDRRLHSPGRRSPDRRMSPDHASRQTRYLPGRHPDKPDRLKQVRPAYEPDTKATNQAMYSGGYRPNVHEPAPYTGPGAGRVSPWHDRREKYGVKKEEERRDVMVSRLSDHGEKRISPRASRSPVRRDRSPIRDRYRRHSPSPRSPRRSWALEKRRSPEHDAPPPPAWPGQSREEYPRPNPPERSEKEVKPAWENTFVKVEDRERGPDFSKSIRVRKDLMHNVGPRDLGPRREPSPHRFKPEDRRDDRFPREPKFEREGERDFAQDRRFQGPDRKKLPDREEFIARSERAHEEFKKKEEMSKLASRGEPYHKGHEQFEEEFQEIYKRAVDFKKKTEELRRHDRRREVEDHRRDMDSERRGREFFQREDYRQEDRPRSRHSDDHKHKREPEWDLDTRKRMDSNVLAKRDKAVEEISRRIIQNYINLVEPEMRTKVKDDVKDRLFNIIYDMYEYKDVSYIELVVKFNTRFDKRDEERIFHESASKYSLQYRGTKRSAPDISEIPAKSSRLTPQADIAHGVTKPTGTILSDWTANPVNLANQMAVQQLYGNQLMNQLVPTVLPTYPVGVPPVGQVYQPDEPTGDDAEGFHLYLCKDNFGMFLSSDVDELKEFLVSEIFNNTATHNWAPSFTFRGLQTPHRYELVTRDTNSRDWLVALDFSGFAKFNVLVYTSEELWYERLAIWLPGHSNCTYINPLQKLQLQNRKLQGAEIGKWKYVKSIVNAKGTRLYIDVPPSAARVLEKKKTLSYELQQVSVFFKAIAIDKAAFDAGLNEPSVEDESVIQTAIQNSPMPTLKNELDVVQITIKGFKNLNVSTARKLKNTLVFEMYKYLKNGGQSDTDFIKYGICMPCSFGVVPANEESKKWLTQLNLGKWNRREIVILGAETENIKRIPLKAYISGSKVIKNMNYVFERLKLSNKGVKGLHFNLWKPDRLDSHDAVLKLLVHIDMESVETLASLKFTLDYLDEHCDNDAKTVTFKYDKGLDRLLQIIKEHKAEQNDSYDVANMDIESSETDDDVICLGEPTDDED